MNRLKRSRERELDRFDRLWRQAEVDLTAADKKLDAIRQRREQEPGRAAVQEYYDDAEAGTYARVRKELDREEAEAIEERERLFALAVEGQGRCAGAVVALFDEKRRPYVERIAETDQAIEHHEIPLTALRRARSESEEAIATLDAEQRREGDEYTAGWERNQRRERERAVRDKAKWYAARVSDPLVMIALQREPAGVRDLVEPERLRLREAAVAQREADHAAALEVTEAGGLHAYDPALGIMP